MAFTIKTLTVKNFMSVGNATQAVDFNRNDLTLVLGENLDLGGDDGGARNGTGKTTIINALSFAFYGNALTNIKKDNLINKTNQKNMMVTIDFEKDGQSYRIERGRKPSVMKFWIGAIEKEITDDAQGDSRETQGDIERMLGMSHDMFRHIVALNTYTEPFLSLRANDQRTIIEQLLGITLLSEKADSLKELNKVTKDSITAEEYRIKAVGDANRRIEEQIENLRRRQTMWQSKHAEDLGRLESALAQLQTIDIDAEVQSHKDLTAYNQKRKDINELQAEIKRIQLDERRAVKDADKLKQELDALINHRCHACGQGIHDDSHEVSVTAKEYEFDAACVEVDLCGVRTLQTQGEIDRLGELGSPPAVFYDKEEDAIHHRATLASLQQQIETKRGEEDPYTEQIVEMQTQGVEEISYDTINELTNLKDHQEFLLKLLTNKDSFIRKRIIDQNLSYLNARLGQYLDRIGLPHTVKFNNDLSVAITELGRDLDFDNLSRGERNRLILSLSWAFRDVWESLYQPINLLFIDELVDSGMDSSGVENSLAILKKMSRDANKSIWLVSHKDELAGRVNNTLHVVKENGFTTYNTDVEIV
jgi:DNA repair exonuclease SbcCD ATPase subunit